ncbi:MAG: U32 family peptidase [Peptoniphilaceae bacterium]|nr:U32 family peptidase [Peptoniphilaceae bacterium]MDY6018457.1 U32 family peptidase [Anaerococcus sp.]
MKKVEILAPVGNFAMLEAGLAAGAYSFYLALDDFGARAYAENFNLDNIKGVIDYIHLFEKKVYITVNTLIKDEEMSKAIYYIEKIYQYGADGILIQDIGLYHLIKDKIKDMELHASTQMAINDYYGAKAAMDLGFNRVVIARETPFSEIEKIVKLPVDIEVFVHGSLCVSFSGECLMSSFLGKRSANRGRCAGICRKKYQLISEGKVLSNDYYLSMNDLNTIDQVDKLVDIGVDCLKIEGRMKTPEYVYTVVKSYRDKLYKGFYNENNLLDIANRPYTKGFIFGNKKSYTNLENSEKRRSLGKVFAKNGNKYFLTNSKLKKGSILQITTIKDKKLPLTLTRDYKKGEEVFLKAYADAKIDSKVLMLNNPSLKEDLEKNLTTYKNLPIDIRFFAKIGQKPRIEISYKDKKVSCKGGEALQKAKNISITEDDIKENLGKLNDQVFKANSIEVFMDKDVFIRKKDINHLRRLAVKLLQEELTKTYHRKPIKINLKSTNKSLSKKREHNIELLCNNVDPSRLEKFDNVYIRAYDPKFKGLSLYYILDSHREYEISKLIKFLKENSIKGVIFNNYRDLSFIKDFKENGIKIRIGRYLNAFNSYAFDFYSDFSQMITASVETTFETINKISSSYPIEVLAFGQIELMTMVHCPFSAYKNCGHVGCSGCKFNLAFLKDEDGNIFDLRRYDSYSKIYATEYANLDINKLRKEVSLLALVSSNDDIDKLENKEKIDNLNYERGVL